MKNILKKLSFVLQFIQGIFSTSSETESKSVEYEKMALSMLRMFQDSHEKDRFRVEVALGNIVPGSEKYRLGSLFYGNPHYLEKSFSKKQLLRIQKYNDAELVKIYAELDRRGEPQHEL